MNWNTEAKARIRKDLFEVSHDFSVATKRPTVSKCAMLVPANTCLCVKAGLDHGRFDKNTFVIALERDAKTTLELKKNLNKLGIKNFAVINDDFCNIYNSFDFIRERCPKIDFAYLDLCGLYCNAVKRSFQSLYGWGIIPKGTPVAYTAQLTDRVGMWSNKDYGNHYKFTTIPSTQENARKLSGHFLKHIVNFHNKEKHIVTYGRAYKNSTGRCAPMITFMCQPKGNLKYCKRHSGDAPYCMGYK